MANIIDAQNSVADTFEKVTVNEETKGEINLENGEKKPVEVFTPEQKKACGDQCANVIKWVAVSVAITGAVAVVLGLLVYFGPLAGVGGISSEMGFFGANAGLSAVVISTVVITINELVNEKLEKEVKNDDAKATSWLSCCNRKQEKTNVEPQSNRPIAEKTKVEETNVEETECRRSSRSKISLFLIAALKVASSFKRVARQTLPSFFLFSFCLLHAAFLVRTFCVICRL